MSTSFWNDRYSAPELIYGDAPNTFLAGQRALLPCRGRALEIGAGQGRNALFLASLGLEVLAVDQSDLGLARARQLAAARGLDLRTQAADLGDLDIGPASLELVVSIFVHLPEPLRARVHRRIVSWLKPGGLFVLEAYSPEQIGRDTGGPKDPALFASLEQIISELKGLRIEHQAAVVRNVSEGVYHTGDASVVQVIARKA